MSGMDWSGMESLADDARFRRSLRGAVELFESTSPKNTEHRRTLVVVKIVKDDKGVPLIAYAERL